MKKNKMNEGKLLDQAHVNGLAAKGAAVNVVELFSGIGGFTKGLMDAGINVNKHYYSEIDKHAIANYKYNFKDAEYIGSVTDVRGKGIERPNIITFGSPCQDFSLAGKRKGMEGQRSSLILHAIRLIGECRPDFFIWENVKGAYSSNDGADFWGIIQAFANIGGYRLEWQLLNTSWFLPQNRERIYLIGHLAKDGRDFRGIFPITENDFISYEQKKSGGRQSQAKLSTALRAGGSLKADDTFIEMPKIAGALTGGGHSGGLHSDMTTIPVCVAQRGRNPENPSDRTTGAHTEQRIEENSQGTTNTLTGVQKDNLIMMKPNHGRTAGRISEISTTLQSDMGTGGDNIPYVVQTNMSGKQFKNNHAGTLRSGASANYMAVNSIRRLTEIECERLQGFPDNWTEYGNYDGKIKSIPKTQRYKLLGNAVTVNVVKAIGLRLWAVAPFAACH